MNNEEYLEWEEEEADEYIMLPSLNEHWPEMQGWEVVDLYKDGWRDFSGMNLEGIVEQREYLIDIDLSGSDLHSSIWQGCDLSGANLSNANLENANLSSTCLVGANVSNANLANANLWYAELSGANLENANLNNVNLVKTNLTGTNFCAAKWQNINTESALFCHTIIPNGSYKSDPVRVIETQELLRRYAAGERRFEGIVLYRADLRGVDLHNIIMPNAHLANANLSGANLQESCLTNVNFRGTDLSGANLKNSCLDSADLSYANLKGANLLTLDMNGVNFTDANLLSAKIFFSQTGRFRNTILPNGEVIVGPNIYPSNQR
ncbi:MAG: pentapeptide repeat-containing protein [Microcoleus sp. PH2017_29_MFU_D_A]|uniref:pentapeptide repeat-containing protein n=1 Tax=unclassified Microcoleus TaxID=2642155 RepID=UPI001D509D33|nr:MULTISPECIES: pentapeptide repeat-containing protein [unclassified Microcoleus]MCC3421240.1 pentapeptide repeat-containing protein [Microcoleus sp. PH2017_07_MST_O_A]MCC3513688.1 pentapeptide repeat-containing protein [Microcoleus sp. PH2017_17_BER_D_A]TAE51386.1 MAG: pentapeptide repeat-containing protein [Oscillatoriales cyanobacterium]MCC3427703.1 pentapeptide repeat-containing protein [Microcoleus sp. PH2017_01_SCD_O_A]MCC3454099.1 pentapeptide repeat-containing protein [Microcoleus sp.